MCLPVRGGQPQDPTFLPSPNSNLPLVATLSVVPPLEIVGFSSEKGTRRFARLGNELVRSQWRSHSGAEGVQLPRSTRFKGVQKAELDASGQNCQNFGKYE